MTIQWSFEIHDILESTQNRAKSLAQEGAAEGVCVQAYTQEAGHGRHGREWVSPPGNFYLSFILRPDARLQDIPQLSLVTSLALAEAIKHDDILLKWPNDVLVKNQKCAGILLEREGDAVIVGVGVNIVSAPEGAACVDVDRDDFLTQFATLYDQWLKGEFDDIRKRWIAKSFKPGTDMTVKHGNHIIEGAFAGLDSAGNLLIKDEQGLTQTLHAGEIHCFSPST